MRLTYSGVMWTQVSVRYVGKLASNGKIFDQTKGKKTFGFRVGAMSTISPTHFRQKRSVSV